MAFLVSRVASRGAVIHHTGRAFSRAQNLRTSSSPPSRLVHKAPVSRHTTSIKNSWLRRDLCRIRQGMPPSSGAGSPY